MTSVGPRKVQPPPMRPAGFSQLVALRQEDFEQLRFHVETVVVSLGAEGIKPKGERSVGDRWDWFAHDATGRRIEWPDLLERRMGWPTERRAFWEFVGLNDVAFYANEDLRFCTQHDPKAPDVETARMPWWAKATGILLILVIGPWLLAIFGALVVRYAAYAQMTAAWARALFQ